MSVLRRSIALVLLIAALAQSAAASGPAVAPPAVAPSAGDTPAAPPTSGSTAPPATPQGDATNTPATPRPTGPSAPRPEPQRISIEIGDSPSLGPADATITIVEFADFQCGYCMHGSSVMERLVKTSSGRVRWVFKHYPLRGHSDAPLAHEAALAAGEQGKFWEMHHRLMRFQYRLKRQDLIDHAAALQLDVAKFTEA